MPRFSNRHWAIIAVLAVGLLLGVTLPALATVVVNPDKTVTFTLEAANISTKVELTYSSEATITVPMTNAGNVWSVTIGPLKPNWYRYWFNVDGMRMHDPLNADHYYSIYGRLWSYFLVPGPEADFLATKAVPHGMVSTVWYHSSYTNSWRNMAVYTPPGYNHDNRKYPVLYLHHGAGNTGFEWIWNNRADFILDNLFAAGKAVPMIVVMPDHSAVPGFLGDPAQDPYPVKELVDNVIPTIEKQFRVLPGSRNRAMAGLSMGGWRTLNTLLQLSDVFDYFCPLSAGWTSAQIDAVTQNSKSLLLDIAAAKNIKLLWISIGTLDPLVTNVQATLALFDKYGIEYTYAPFPDGRHEPDVWRHNLYDFAPLLFRAHGPHHGGHDDHGDHH